MQPCAMHWRMKMNEKLMLVLACIAGSVLGTMFFGGLWWTVRKVIASSKPALWVLTSLLLRLGLTLAGFYFVSGGDWPRLLACLVGFVMARQLVTWLTRLPEKHQAKPVQEARPAP